MEIEYQQDPDLLVTLMFKRDSFKRKTENGTNKRTELIRKIFFTLTKELGLGNNNIVFCGVQKTNNKKEVYAQLLVYCIRTDRVSVEESQRKLIEIIERFKEEIIIPSKLNENLQYEHVKRIINPQIAFSLVFDGLRNNDRDLPIIKTFKFDETMATKSRWLKKQKETQQEQ